MGEISKTKTDGRMMVPPDNAVLLVGDKLTKKRQAVGPAVSGLCV